jgi:polar amino acid transport system substrate-binding protein
MKKSLVFIMIGMMLLAIAGCGQADDDKLVVGMELQYPPFETTDEDGNPMGISVDLAYALGDYLGKEVVIENTAWSGLIPAIQSEKIDIIISSMSIRPDRAESVAFSDPYSHSTLAILANKDSGVEYIDDLDAAGMKVAVKVGTTGFLYVTDNFTEAEIITVDKADTAILEVAQGKSDAFLYDQMSIYNAAELYPDTTVALLEPFQDEAEYWAMAVKLDNDELLEQVNAFIAEYSAEGGFDALGDKYLGDMKRTFEENGIDFFFQPESDE